jgi:hypothetical protein
LSPEVGDQSRQHSDTLSPKQNKINEVRKSIQNLDKKVSIMEEKFSKEMEIMKKKNNPS